jgi:hypothetical protein
MEFVSEGLEGSNAWSGVHGDLDHGLSPCHGAGPFLSPTVFCVRVCLSHAEGMQHAFSVR